MSVEWQTTVVDTSRPPFAYVIKELDLKIVNYDRLQRFCH